MTMSNEARLGITVFLAVIFFVAGVIYLRGIDLERKEYSLTIFYNNVNGLQEGSPLTVAGLAIGKVQSMRLAGTAIAVNVSIEKQVRLPVDSKAYIKSASIMGGKLIAFTPGTSQTMLEDGDSLSGSYEADLTELTSTLAPISSNVLGILERVNTTFDEKTRQHIQGILSDVNTSSSELQSIIQREGAQLDIAIANFSAFSSTLSRFAKNLDTIAISQRGNLDTSIARVREVAYNLQDASDRLKQSSLSLSVVLAKVERGQGTLGKLVHDQGLYDDIDSLAVNLNRLVKDLRENPNRYVRVSVF